jgi:hypothetical protein
MPDLFALESYCFYLNYCHILRLVHDGKPQVEPALHKQAHLIGESSNHHGQFAVHIFNFPLFEVKNLIEGIFSQLSPPE